MVIVVAEHLDAIRNNPMQQRDTFFDEVYFFVCKIHCRYKENSKKYKD